jgi:acetyl esterase/lipase
LFPLLYNTFSTDLLADGWATVFPPTPGLLYRTTQSLGVLAELNTADQGAGLATTMEKWIDHIVNYVATQITNADPSVPIPIVLFGVSFGAQMALLGATQRTSSIAAYGAHIAPCKLWTANPAVLSAGATGFFGTADWLATVASGSNGVTLPISGGVLNITGLTGATPAASGTIIIVRGAGGWQILNYTGFNGSTQFTGCTGGNTGNGALATGDVVQHSAFTTAFNIPLTGLNALGNGQQGSVPPGWIGCETGDSFIGYADQTVLANNAIGASQPVTLYKVTGGGHEFGSADVNAAMSWITGTVDPLCPAVH